MARRSASAAASCPDWLGRRAPAPAGRKDRAGPRMGHDRRARHDARHPVLLTLRAARGVPSLRSRGLFTAVRDAITQTGDAAFRVLHFSVQQDHVHAILEGDSHDALVAGIRGLVIRIALAVKRVARVRKVWAIATTHARWRRRARFATRSPTCCSTSGSICARRPASILAAQGPGSAAGRVATNPAAAPAPTSAARTWLAATGWRRLGLIHTHEQPGSARRNAR